MERVVVSFSALLESSGVHGRQLGNGYGRVSRFVRSWRLRDYGLIDNMQRQRIRDAVAGNQSDRVTARFCVRRYLNPQLDSFHDDFARDGGRRLRFGSFDGYRKGRLAHTDGAHLTQAAASDGSDKAATLLTRERVYRDRARILTRLHFCSQTN